MYSHDSNCSFSFSANSSILILLTICCFLLMSIKAPNLTELYWDFFKLAYLYQRLFDIIVIGWFSFGWLSEFWLMGATTLNGHVLFMCQSCAENEKLQQSGWCWQWPLHAVVTMNELTWAIQELPCKFHSLSY